MQFVVSIIAPGVAAVRRPPLVALALFVAGVVLPIGLMFRVVANRDDLIGFAPDERLLVWVTVIGVLAVLARVAAVAEVAVRHRASPNIVVKTSVAAVVLIALAVPSAIVLSQVNHTREVVGDVFSSSDDDTPLFSSATRVDLDGTLAVAYVRARRGDSDYYRMSRQRDALAALGSQVSTRDAINAFPKVADALEDSMKTSLSSSEFSELLDRLGDSAKVGETVGLAPPLITPSRPDFDNVKSIVAAVRNYVRTGEASGYDS